MAVKLLVAERDAIVGVGVAVLAARVEGSAIGWQSGDQEQM